MKIEAGGVSANQLETAWPSKQTATGGVSIASPHTSEDRTSLTSDKATIKSLVNQAMATPDVRQDKVQQLRQSMNSGAYKVDTQKLAAAMSADTPE